MKITECPRELIQSMTTFVPTELKTKYINTILQIGFDTIDFGSFVSPKAIPQMKDVVEVVNGLYLLENTKLSAIIGNQKGFEGLAKFEQISVVGFPFSISNMFLKMNINSTIEKSLDRLEEIVDYNISYDKELLVYISMGFGNQYEEEWSVDILLDYIDILYNMDITRINISDTIGIATQESIKEVFDSVIKEFPDVTFGFHLHTDKKGWYKKIQSAYESGIRIFDSVIGGYGGCPMTGYEMIGNINTNHILDFCYDQGIDLKLNKEWYEKANKLSKEIYEKYK